MRWMVLADIHHGENKWELLVQAAKAHKPDLVAVAGDLLPKDQRTLAQVAYLPGLRAYAEAINAAGAELVLILGNDENGDIGCFTSGYRPADLPHTRLI